MSLGFYVRQLRDRKGSVNIAGLGERRFARYCELCGWALACAHAHSGDPAQISGYLGSNETFAEIARLLNMRETTVRTSFYRALPRLRRALTGTMPLAAVS